MTKYQEKRRFLSKINARIKTLTKRAGVKPSDLTSLFDDIDGVWITDSGNVNMKTAYFSDSIVEQIEGLIPTYLAEADRAKQEIKDSWKKAKNFIGPRPAEPSEKVINRNIRAGFRFTNSFNENKAKFYEWADKQSAISLKTNKSYTDLEKKLSEFGSKWYKGELTAQDRLDQLDDLNKLGFNDVTKLIANNNGLADELDQF